jgi:hypothetical protein
MTPITRMSIPVATRLSCARRSRLGQIVNIILLRVITNPSTTLSLVTIHPRIATRE